MPEQQLPHNHHSALALLHIGVIPLQQQQLHAPANEPIQRIEIFAINCPQSATTKKTKQQKQSILLFELYCIFWNHLFLRNKINSNLRVYDVPLFVHFLFWFCFAVFCLFSIWLLLAARCTRYDHLHFIVQLKISPLCAVIAMPKMHCIIIN